MCLPRKSEKKEKCRVTVCILIKVHEEILEEMSRFYYLKSLVLNAIVVGLFFAMILFIFVEFGKVDKAHKLSLPKSCPSGFTFDPIRSKCFDIDECTSNPCNIGHSQICENLIGSFNCKKPNCPIGYRIHASHRSTHVNKCVRKRCRRKDAKCHRMAKYRSFKTFHISHASARTHGGIVMHEIYTRKFKNGIVVDMAAEEGECVGRGDIELRLITIGKMILILKNISELIEKCTNDTKNVELRFKSRSNEKVIENLSLKLNFEKE